MNAIEKLVENNIPVKINFTLNKHNQNDLFKVIEITERLNIPISTPTYMFPPVRKVKDNKHFNEHRLSAKEAARIQYQLAKYSIKENPNDIESVKATLAKIDPKNFDFKSSDMPSGFLCAAGVRSFWINWRGILSPCGMMENPNCNLNEISFKEGWEYITFKSNDICLSLECYNCRFRNICQNCGASSFAETGKTDNVVAYHCNLCQEYEKLLKKLVKEVEDNENK